jgi:hypothetical protein
MPTTMPILNQSATDLDSRIDRVGAGAAALAALHPLDFDPDAKWDFAAEYGNYKGADAVAVGTYYRPNRRYDVQCRRQLWRWGKYDQYRYLCQAWQRQ